MSQQLLLQALMGQQTRNDIDKNENVKITVSLFIMTGLLSFSLGLFQYHSILNFVPDPILDWIVDEETQEIRRNGEKYEQFADKPSRLSSQISEISDFEDQYQALLEYAIDAKTEGITGEAILAYRRLISINPSDTESLKALAKLYLSSAKEHIQDPYQALQLMRQVLKHADTRDNRDLLSKINSAMSDKENATRVLAKDKDTDQPTDSGGK